MQMPQHETILSDNNGMVAIVLSWYQTKKQKNSAKKNPKEKHLHKHTFQIVVYANNENRKDNNTVPGEQFAALIQ